MCNALQLTRAGPSDLGIEWVNANAHSLAVHVLSYELMFVDDRPICCPEVVSASMP